MVGPKARRQLLRALALAGLSPAGVWAQAAPSMPLPAPASTGDWPRKPVRLIVPFAAGGGNDAVARLIGRQLADRLGQPVLIDNRPGAGGVLGGELAAKAPADGYTLFLGGVGSHAVNPALHRHLPYDPVRDFAPVILLASAPAVVVVNPAVPARTLAELVELARSRPGALAYASNGNGSSAHLAAALFESMAGVRMTHVPYKGLSPALTDLLSGEVQLMFSSAVAILPHVEANRLRALAVTGAARSPLLPGTPTVAEVGWPGYVAGSWYGLLATAGTPADRLQRLNLEATRILALPAVREQLAREGSEPGGGTPQDFAEHIRRESVRLAALVRSAGLPAD